MPDYSAGEARLAVVPDASEFKRKLEADMRKLNAEFTLGVRADTAQARADIARFRDAESRSGVRMGVEMGLAQAQNDMRSFRDRNNQLAVKVDLEDGEAKARMAALRAEARANNARVKVDVDTGGALSKITELDKTFSSILGSLGKGLKLNLGLVGIGELPAATLLITQAAGALQQLAQAGLALPGILGGAVSSIGTLAIGLDGIGDAYKAVTKAQDDAYKDGPRQAQAMTSAQNANRNATVDLAQAQRDLGRTARDARDQLADLNLQVQGGRISEDQAVINAMRQRRDLQKDLASGQIKDQLDYQSRLLDIQQADQSVAEARQRNISLQGKVAEANQKGITNSDAVVAANERVTRAQQAVADSAAAVANAQQGSAGSQAAAQAMSDLGENARQVVDALVNVRSQAKGLRNDLSDKMLAGIGKGIRTLVASDLPTFERGLGGIATAWNGTLTQILSTVGSDRSKGLLDQLFGNTADAQNRLTTAIQPGIDAILQLVATGSNALPRLADDVKAVADRFDGFISGAAADGRLDKWINDGITGFERVGNTLINVGSAIGAVTRAAGGGDGFLATLQRGSEKLATFLNSTEGQNKLKEWFKEGRDEIENHIIPLLKQLPGFIQGVVTAGQTIADIVVPPLKDISKFLGDHPDLIKAVVTAFAGWKGIVGVTSLINDLTNIQDKLGTSGGKKGVGGKGILGALALLTGGALLQDALDDDGKPKKDPKPGESPPAAKPVAPGALNPGDLPAGSPVPFGTVPVVTPKLAADLTVGAGKGALAGSPFGPVATTIGAGVGALAAIPDLPEDKRNELEKTIDTLLVVLPRLPDDAIKTGLADPLGLTVDRVKSMSRNELRQLWLTVAASGTGGTPPPPPPDPTYKGGGGGFAKGGVLPGYSPGRDNMLVPLAGGEGIIRPEVVAKLGPDFIHALNGGAVPGYAPGGAVIDPDGNPVTPGPLPGPSPTAPNAPNPLGGGVQSVANSLLGTLGSGLGLPAIPGLGMPPVNPAGPAPAGDVIAGKLGGIGAQFLTDFYQKGILGFFGLEGSVLSPSNKWFQAGAKSLGILSNLPGMDAAGGMPSIGARNIPLGDGSMLQIPMFAPQGGAGIAANPAMTFGADGQPLSASSVSAIQYAQGHAHGQKYVYGGVGAANADGVPGYDCSGIASAVYAAATGKPQGQRYFTTESDFTALGFQPGYQPGALNIGIMRGGGGPNSHMALTLPNGVNVESGGASDSTQYGGSAAGALSKQFQLHYYLPMNGNAGAGAVPGLYAYGGDVSGGVPGRDSVPAMLMPGEHVLTTRDVNAMGGQGGVYAFRNALHMAPGGAVPFPDALLQPLPPLPPRPTTAPPPPAMRPVNPAVPAPSPAPTPAAPRGAAVIPSAPTTPLPGPIGEAPPAPAQPQATAVEPWQAGAGPTPEGRAPTNLDHNLDAINTGIDSAAQAIGQAVSTAIGVAGGAAGGFGGGAVGAIGPYVAGLIKQGGKIAKNVANVGSSFLVGSVPGSFGDPNLPAGGQLQMPAQNIPQTANDNRSTNNWSIQGVDFRNMWDQVQLREAQHAQAALATQRG